jgi:hypothetical protein
MAGTGTVGSSTDDVLAEEKSYNYTLSKSKKSRGHASATSCIKHFDEIIENKRKNLLDMSSLRKRAKEMLRSPRV